MRGGNKKQTNKNKFKQFVSSLKIRYYMLIETLQTLINLCESIPFNRAVQKYNQ